MPAYLKDENYERSKQLFAGAPLLARVGVIRLFELNPAPPSLPPQQRAQIAAFNSSTRQVSATTEEFRATPETTAQVGRTGSLGDEPLAVVSAGKHLRGWLKLQGELAALSSDSSHRVVERATHTSLVDDRSDAQATSTAIVEVVQSVRNDRPFAR